MQFAGFPTIMLPASTLCVTTVLAPTTAKSPTDTPGPTNASAQIQTLSPTQMGDFMRGKSGFL